MRRRLTEAIVSVVVLTVLVLGIPLAVAVQRVYVDSATVGLQRQAAQALAEITLPLDPAALRSLSSEPDTPPLFTVYDQSGARLVGAGPLVADAAVRRALAGSSSTLQTSTELIVAIPITDRTNETVVGAVRVVRVASEVNDRVKRAWIVMGLAALIAVLGGWVIARTQARRLTAPVEQLAERARRIGSGELLLDTAPSGVTELDAVDAALISSSSRLADLLSRERAFSADVSHQLRTPLTGLRLRLEAIATTEAGSAGPSLVEALADIDRLDNTVEHLLALSRDALPVGTSLDLNSIAEAAGTRWRPHYDAAQRTLVVRRTDRPLIVSASRAALDQVLDVLLDNSLRHGAGATTVATRSIRGGAAIDVSDRGGGIAPAELESVFRRRHGTGTGIGLSLARALVEAEGGRLVLAEPAPPRFSVLFTEAAASS